MANKLVSKALGKSIPTKSPTSPKAPKPSSGAASLAGEPDRRYMVEDGLRTLVNAERIRKDKALMRDIAKHAAMQHKIVTAKG